MTGEAVVNERTKAIVETLRKAAQAIEDLGIPRAEYAPVIMATLAIISGMLADNILGATVVCITEDEEGDEEASQVSFATVKMTAGQMLSLAGRLHALSNRIGAGALAKEEEESCKRCQQEQEREGVN
jgi:hypothetical protein